MIPVVAGIRTDHGIQDCPLPLTVMESLETADQQMHEVDHADGTP